MQINSHGYLDAIKSQILHGIFEYCGATVVASELFYGSQTEKPSVHLARAHDIGAALFAAAERPAEKISA